MSTAVTATIGASGLGVTQLEPSSATARPEGAVALIARLLAEHPEPVAIASRAARCRRSNASATALIART